MADRFTVRIQGPQQPYLSTVERLSQAAMRVRSQQWQAVSLHHASTMRQTSQQSRSRS